MPGTLWCPGCKQVWPAEVFVYEDGLCALCNLEAINIPRNPLLP